MHKGYLDTADGQIHYWSEGSGPDLLAIHQAGQCSEEYRGLAAHLRDSYRIWAIDLPGHGPSENPAQEFEVDDYTRVTTALLDAQDIHNVSILGHHGGSSIAIDIAAAQPERVRALILSGCGIRMPEETQALLAQRGTRKVSIENDGEFLTGMWGRYVALTSDTTPAADTLRPFLIAQAQQLRPYDAHDAILRWDRKPRLEKVQCPVLLLQGELDSFVNRQEALLEMIPGSRREVIPDRGAFMFYEDPATCARVIGGFLDAL